MPTLLQEIPAWLSVLVALAGAVVSGLSLGRSRWATFLLGGFVAEATALACSRVAVLAIRNGVLAAPSVAVVFAATSLLALAGRGAVVAGVAGVLADLRTASVASANEPTP